MQVIPDIPWEGLEAMVIRDKFNLACWKIFLPGISVVMFGFFNYFIASRLYDLWLINLFDNVALVLMIIGIAIILFSIVKGFYGSGKIGMYL